MKNAVTLEKIEKIIPIFKNGIEAQNICVIKLYNLGWDIVVQKGLYKINDEAYFIQPDFCLSDIALFDSFIRPGGELNKSKLGKNNRIRAIKFNFQFEGKTDPIFSFGILLPKTEVDKFIKRDCDVEDITEILGITKYEEPESAGSGLVSGGKPLFLYTTDEDNIMNQKSHVSRLCNGNTEFGITIKRDGSSFTQYFRKNEETFYTGICSRNLEKKLEQSYVSEYVDSNGNTYHKYINPETKIKGWFCDSLNDFKTDKELENNDSFTTIKTEVKDSWIDLSHKSGLFENGMKYCIDNDVQLVFRAEIFGQGLKGSGNKSNPDSNSKQTLCVFGIDRLETGFSVRQHFGDEYNIVKVCEDLNLEYTKSIFVKPNSFDELIEICNKIFEEEKQKGRIIEGVVIRTKYSNECSVKYLSPEYDSKK